ncbi:MAG TPA: Stk1 family PASTA domain-containing Ser/Thr kinase [Clostridium sp.]|uniref:Stk1 family PASTA domain-containing Ser/Thr kinase n=1 Tax=Clostridium sp. TaxID=1506 RepID=UPI002F94E0A4
MIGRLLLNRYELLEKIGEGGMGTVYKAKCHLLNRFVAVKILKAELSNDEEFVSRFKREAISVAKMAHPNIVNVHDVGEENHVNFIVLEYINGKTLKQVIKENGRLSSEKTIDIVFQISKGLEAAHKNNIIHRDIKPDNIMITDDGTVKVMDFGIAKVLDSRTVTKLNNVMGTAHYFSPEQAKGSIVDCRTDIYSLGIVMYEMVTGRVPYNAESAITIAMMHIQELPIPPKEIIKDIPENVNQVILKAMQKEPNKRYQTAKEMAEKLREIKEESKVKVINDLDDGTKIMGAAIASDIKNDYTTVMSEAAGVENTTAKKDKEGFLGKKRLSTNKKAMIVIASIILVIIASVLGKFISKGMSDKTSIPVVKTIVPKAVEMKVVPPLIGSTQDIAEQIIVNDGFLLGNISNDYSDNIAKGLVISQSPAGNTSYEKDGKIDLVISLGKKAVQVMQPQVKMGKEKNKGNHNKR